MAPRKPRKTKTPANYNPNGATPQADPQTNCPPFKLPRELRDMIYTYVFGPGPEFHFNINRAVADLGNRYYEFYQYPSSASLSGALLSTCRRINPEAAPCRSLALLVDLSSARRRDNSADDSTGLVPRLDNDQMAQLKRLTVIVHSGQSGKVSKRYVERILPCGTPYWARDGSDDSERDELVGAHVEGVPVLGAERQRTLKKRQFDKIVRAAMATRTCARPVWSQ